MERRKTLGITTSYNWTLKGVNLLDNKQKNIYDRVCRQCGASFKGGPRAWYCPSCRIERRRELNRKRVENGRKPARLLGSIDQCVVCGKDYIVNGGLQRYCPKCAPEKYKEVDRKQGLEYYEANKDTINPVRKEARRTIRNCPICGNKYWAVGGKIACCQEHKKEVLRIRLNMKGDIMSRKTITERIKRCKDEDMRNKIILEWLDAWESEQIRLCDKLPLATDIHDFDELCIVNGQLREITNKKFTALYNILRVIGLPEQAQEGGQIYGWGKYQTGLIAIMGRHIAAQKWDEIKVVVDKLMASNKTSFKGVKYIISEHQNKNVSDPVAMSTIDDQPIKKSATVQEIIETYNKTDSLKETAALCGVNWQKVRKILITAGKYENDESRTIAELYKSGLAVDEIASRLGLTAKAVNSYLPYTKGQYNSDSPSENAIAIRRYREKSRSL